MADKRRTPGENDAALREADARIEELAREIAQIVNGAGPERRQDLREYALGLIKEETEVIEAHPAPGNGQQSADASPLGMALLLGMIAFPLALLFPFAGILLLLVAVVLGVIGFVGPMLRR